MKEEDVDAIARALCSAHADAPTLDGWQAAARAAIALGARPRDGATARARLGELIGAGSTNFLGTGLTMRELLELHSAEKLSRSWALQPREEQRRRLAAVVRLSVELSRVRETTSFATQLAEMAIESVIEGDWKMVEEWAEHFAFADEREEIRTSASALAWIAFRELLLQAVRAEKGVAA
jgi:hypothetical protein